MPYPVKGFLEINENMVQRLLMLEVHSGLKIYSVVLLPALDPAVLQQIMSLAWVLK